MENKQRYIIWKKQAEFDLQIAKISFDNNFFEWSAYQANQSAEKILKAYLSKNGYFPPKTHKISVLAYLANRISGIFQKTNFDFKSLEVYTFITRYPFTLPRNSDTPHEIITREAAATSLLIAENLFDLLSVELDSDLENYSYNSKKSSFFYSKYQIKKRIEIITSSILSSRNFEIKKIILFGSFAKSFILPNTTTIDLLIVAETKLNFIDRIIEIKKNIPFGYPLIEPVVYTTAEYEYMKNDKTEGYIEKAINEGKILYSI